MILNRIINFILYKSIGQVYNLINHLLRLFQILNLLAIKLHSLLGINYILLYLKRNNFYDFEVVFQALQRLNFYHFLKWNQKNL